MPVTKTAKRALRSSKRKEIVNQQIRANLEAAIRIAKKSSRGRLVSGRKKTEEAVITAISLVDRAAKRNVIHKNKAARIKSSLSKLLPRRAKGSSGPVEKTKTKK